MSSVNYDLKNKGVRLIDAKDAWIISKNGKRILNPEYRFVGKMDICMSNMLITASDKSKPVYKGDINQLNSTAKKEIINHFYNEDGKRNKKRVAYFGIKKN